VSSGLLLLTYHGVHEEFDPAKDDFIYSLPLGTFLQQMDFLNFQSHVRTQTLHNLKERHDDKTVVLTFDDGLRSSNDFIWPALLKRNLKGVFFVSPALVGKRGYLDWVDVRRMAEEGAEFGTHGFSHRLFEDLGEDDLRREIVDSKKELEDQIGQKVVSLAAPGGSFHPRAVEMASQAGYRFLCTSRRYLNPLPPPFLLGRFPIKRKTPWWFFKPTVLMNKTALDLHRLIDEGKRLSKRMVPGMFTRIREWAKE
jgi:peptidoglycan/xylan/chitin deacetylase (PgdA/CDA1 family)